jgi:hypothetical protein
VAIRDRIGLGVDCRETSRARGGGQAPPWTATEGVGPEVKNSKPGHVRALSQIRPSPENDSIYAPIALDDPQIIELAKSIHKIGIQEPIMISQDDFIISGHRRYVAAQLAGLLWVPVKLAPISRAESPKEFLELLVAMNSQRVKTTGDHLREALAKLEPKDAHQQIVNERLQKDRERRNGDLTVIQPDDIGRRDAISLAKMPMLKAALAVLNDREEFWPLTVRQVHYLLLGPDAPLRHASKPDSTYVNTKQCYKDLCDLLARARVAGLCPWEALEDETRKVELNDFYRNPKHFFESQFKSFLGYYYRNLQQSQPNHIEILAEKLTVFSTVQSVASKYTIPLTISRGMNTIPPKKKIYDRFRMSAKRSLILLVVGDLDPMGETIVEDPIKSFQRDFGLSWDEIEGYRVALTSEQVEELGLAPSMKAKETSATYEKFVARYDSTDAYELEAMEPADLAGVLEKAVQQVMDIDLYNQELKAEERIRPK